MSQQAFFEIGVIRMLQNFVTSNRKESLSTWACPTWTGC